MNKIFWQTHQQGAEEILRQFREKRREQSSFKDWAKCGYIPVLHVEGNVQVLASCLELTEHMNQLQDAKA